MIPEKEPVRKRPYVLLPASDSGPTDAPNHGPDDEATFSLRFAFREATTAAVSHADSAFAASTAERELAPAMAGPGEASRVEKGARRTGSLLDGLAFAVLLSVIGSTAGYYLAGQWTADSLTWSVVGGTAGLLLGGGLLLWTRRRR